VSGRAVAVYDLSGNSGWAVYSPDLDEPEFGVLRLPPTTLEGSVGPALHLLFDHICWINKRWPLRALGSESVLLPTGGKKDDDTSFTTSPKTIKKQVSLTGCIEMCASMLAINHHSIHNASWRRYWLGSKPRGTQREEWKALSKAKARGLGWDVRGDDDADALGQLHFLLHKLEISTRYGRNPSQELIQLGYQKNVPIHV
jgi:hypothetical protein